MGLSRAINKLSLLSKLILLESLEKMVKSLKFMLQLQVSTWSEVADCLTFLKHLFVKCEIPICSVLHIPYKNLVSTLLHCGFMVCSSYRTLHFEILKLKQIFRSNRYPQNFVDCCIKIYLDKVFIKHPEICVVSKKELVCVFSFLGKKSLEIKEWLQNAIKRTLSYCKSKVIFKSPSKIVNHFHFKDVLPKNLCSGIVSSFKCNSCNAIYYNQTKHHFCTRAAERLGIWHLTDKRLKNVKESAISSADLWLQHKP